MKILLYNNNIANKKGKSMTKQLAILAQDNIAEESKNACIFTGHRELGEDFSVRKLKNAIEELIQKGITDFYNGMAKGFDLAAATAVIKLKKKYPNIRLIACIPCYEQEKYFSEKDKKTYVSVLKKADEKVVLSPTYYRGCMQVRDRYMAERASVMIAYCKKAEGGAAYTVKIFQKMNPFSPIVFL
ncbi:MAG: DUF1273 domain-containing protein [Clostridiales bacterium]|nr:DUF1273 domain-containing protein [Clostridiales bacterium]